jgi:glutathione S-transferase
VLVLDDGETLIESAAILDALDDMAPSGRRLIASGGIERRRVLRFCALATGLADKAVSLLYERVLRKEERRNAVWIARCEAQIRDTLGVLERERADGATPFWVGSLSHADIALACALRFTREAHARFFASQPIPHLLAHAERAEAMPIFQSALQPLTVAVDSTSDG